MPSPVPAPMCAPSKATSTGGPPKVIRQITLVGGPSDNNQSATSTGGQVSASVESQASASPSSTGTGRCLCCHCQVPQGDEDSAFPSIPGGVRVSSHYGSLFTPGDNRPRACFSDFRFGDKQNLMYSFNPSTLKCNSERGERRAIVLSDQNFSSGRQQRRLCQNHQTQKRKPQ